MPAIELIPSAKRLITSLRDLGYDFSQAVADIVDNCIEAGASRVAIDVEFDGDESWVRVADNGTGMKPEGLREAMRFGTERDYREGALGKFGLGLKTASMSQCQQLTVASRWNPDRADITAYSWDLAHIERTNRWEILPVERNGLGPATRQILKDSVGTVVLWQRLDRLLGYKHPYGESSRKRLSQMCRDLELHLRMVFHRFLAGDAPLKRRKLLLNGNPITPWDPFCRAEPRTKQLQAITLPIQHENVSGEVLLQPYVLPHQDDFSSPEAFRAASGPAGWNQQQGFYVYRAGRMIQSGGWSNLHAPDEHIKLARVALSFSPALDEAFKINVAKMRVQLPAQIREAILAAIGPVRRLAREVYDRKTPRPRTPPAPPPITPPAVAQSSPSPGDPPRTPLSPQPTSGSPQERPSPTFTLEEWAELLLGKATVGERPLIETVLSRLRQSRSG